MMWIADYDAHGKEFPTCVHVTRTAQNGVISGATYVPIWDGKEARNERDALERRIDELCAEAERLRKELSDVYALFWHGLDCTECPWFDECDTTGGCPWLGILADHLQSLGIEVPR